MTHSLSTVHASQTTPDCSKNRSSEMGSPPAQPTPTPNHRDCTDLPPDPVPGIHALGLRTALLRILSLN